MHRDLDETAVANLRARGGSLFLNFWVPFNAVLSDHLGLCLPSSVDIASQAAPFKGLTGDRTGLTWGPQQQWIVACDLRPGDVLIWQSDRVYHSNVAPAEADHGMYISGGQRRRSVDLRLWYFQDTISDK